MSGQQPAARGQKRAAKARRHAFTLIEVMIAIGLSSVLCLSAYATLRMCSQSVAVVNRLSLENGMLRNGLLSALDELDLWTSYDDPNDASKQPLRLPGRPFSRLDITGEDFDTDFDPSDAKTWYRGPSQRIRTGKKYGDTSLFAKQDFVDADSAKQAERRWTANTLKSISSDLGYYALSDYLPPGMVLMYNLADGESAHEFSHLYYTDPAYDATGSFRPVITASSGQETPYDLLADRGGAFTITTNPDYLARDVDHHYFQGWTIIPFFEHDTYWKASHIRERCGSQLDLMTEAPSHWPKVEILVHHTHYVGRFNDNASIILSSPQTGQKLKLYITATATTLRGARRQRGLDANELP